jgi:hypothetical protein
LASCTWLIVFFSTLLPGKLGRQNFDIFNHRRLHEQFGSFRHQRRGDPSREMCLAARLVRKGVEDAER